MTEKYCDWTNGDDNTGDGSYGNPYKTIQKASTGLTGNDEVRCAKSPDHSTLSGTMTWTNGSVLINTSADLRGVLARNDFIQKTTLAEGDYNIWWRIWNVNAASIELAASAFIGITQSGITSKKLGVHNLGTVAVYNDIVQYINASGTSASSLLKVTGGWDLTTQQRTGESWYWQAGTNLYGYLLSIDNQGWLEIDGINCLRGYWGLRLANITSYKPTLFKNAQLDGGCFYNNTASFTTLQDCRLLGSPNVSLYSVATDINNCIMLCSGIWNGAYMRVYNSTFLGTSSFNQTLRGVNNIFLDCSFGNNTIYCQPSTNTIFYNCLQNNAPTVTDAQYYAREVPENFNPLLKIVKYNRVAGDHRSYYINGRVVSNTAQARSGICAEFIPSSSSYYMDHFLAWIQAQPNIPRTIKYYIKKSNTFNGSVYAALFFNGRYVTNFTEVTPSTDYEQKSIAVSGSSITTNGVIGLKIRVKGDTGSIYIDDIDFT